MITTIENLVDYLRDFHKTLQRSPSLPSSLIPDDLPRSLRLLYRELGALVESDDLDDGHAPFGTQDRLTPLSRLKRIDGMIEFAWENQGNWSCRCASLEEDPPVLCDVDVAMEGNTEFRPVCDSVSHFLTTLSLQEAVMSAPFLLSVQGEVAAQVLTSTLRPLWLRGQYVFDEPVHSFYDIPGRDVLVMEHSGIWVASHSDAPLQLLRSDARYQLMNDDT